MRLESYQPCCWGYWCNFINNDKASTVFGHAAFMSNAMQL